MPELKNIIPTEEELDAYYREYLMQTGFASKVSSRTWIGSIPVEDVAAELSALVPDEVCTADEFGLTDILADRFEGPVVVAWWD